MDKLDAIISQLDELQNTYKFQQETANQNSQSFILRLPKVILIQRVCAFLEDKDLYILTSTCSTLRKVMFCPLGFKLLFVSRNANHIIGARPKPQNVEKESKIDLSLLGTESSSFKNFDEEEDAIAQLTTLRSVKDFLTMELKKSVNTINKLEDQMDDLQMSLKYEKSVNLKLQSKINILQNQLATSELQRQDAKENLGELNTKYSKIIAAMESDKQGLFQEKEQLLAHKKLLIEEVYKLRDQVKELQQSQENYKYTLSQVKTFMDSIDLKPLQQSI